MKIIVTGKNINVSEKIQTAIEKKFDKFGKYFADDVKANVVMHPEKAKVKMEATIVARNTIFRAENVSQDIFDCIDIVADKLAKQISKYKDKMIKKNKSNESVRFEMIPEMEEKIRYITMRLDENERGNISRLMTVKDMIIEDRRLWHPGHDILTDYYAPAPTGAFF